MNKIAKRKVGPKKTVGQMLRSAGEKIGYQYFGVSAAPKGERNTSNRKTLKVVRASVSPASSPEEVEDRIWDLWGDDPRHQMATSDDREQGEEYFQDDGRPHYSHYGEEADEFELSDINR